MAQIFGNDWADGPARVSRWGHAGPTIFVGIIGSMAALAVLPVTYPPGGKPLVSLAFIALMLMTFGEMRKHDRGLCERCVADFPLNPAQDAETYSGASRSSMSWRRSVSPPGTSWHPGGLPAADPGAGAS